MMQPKEVLLVEDSEQTREWLASLVRTVFPSVRLHLASLIQEAQVLLNKFPIDLALVDIHLPDGNGVDLLRNTKINQEIYWVITTVFGDDEHVFDALRNGACGYLLKEQTDEQLKRHLAGIVDGQPPLSPRIANRLLQYFQPEDCPVLTERELEVLELIAQGLSQKETAKELQLSVYTVGDHIKHIYQKLRVRNRASAIAQAARLGLIKH